VVLNPLVVREKGRLKGALGGQDRIAKSSTKRLPSAFKLPPSTAPTALDRSYSPQEHALCSTIWPVIDCHWNVTIWKWACGTYEPGTPRERQYMSGLSSVYKDDCMEDTAKLADEAMENETQNSIDVEVPSDWG
jgi:hypothetical protein